MTNSLFKSSDLGALNNDFHEEVILKLLALYEDGCEIVLYMCVRQFQFMDLLLHKHAETPRFRMKKTA